jgi:hypothetical protein
MISGLLVLCGVSPADLQMANSRLSSRFQASLGAEPHPAISYHFVYTLVLFIQIRMLWTFVGVSSRLITALPPRRRALARTSRQQIRLAASQHAVTATHSAALRLYVTRHVVYARARARRNRSVRIWWSHAPECLAVLVDTALLIVHWAGALLRSVRYEMGVLSVC